MNLYKHIIAVLLFLISVRTSAQTFSNNISEAHNSWNSGFAWATALSKTITVSGLPAALSNTGTVLKQINLRLGDGTNTGLNLSSYVMRLYHPDGVTFIEICSGATGDDCGGTSIRDVNIKYRDHTVLRSAGQLAAPSSAWPYHIGYYRVVAANSFTTFNGLNPNGNWVLKIVENTATEIAFSGVDLVFGSPFNIVDLTTSNANDLCTGAQCLDNSNIYIATNNGYANPGPGTDPGITVGSCSWNGAINNTAWFFFQASGPTVSVSISGLSAQLQSIGLHNSGTCAAPSYSVPSGGCPNDAVNNNYGGGASHGATGMSYNHNLNFSGLVNGNNYNVVIDGTGGAISPFYIEITGNTQSCAVILPIELTDFNFNCQEDAVKLIWTTSTEYDNEKFTLLASDDGNEWFEIGQIKGAGNSIQPSHYEFNVPLSYSSYKLFRLKQTDFNGKSKYSRIIHVNCDKTEDELVFYPNPFEETLFFEKTGGKVSDFSIWNEFGQIMHEGSLDPKKGQIDLRDLPSGAYILKTETGKFYKLMKNAN